MNCREFAKIMGEYANRTLGEQDAERAQAHVSACAACAAKACELERTSGLIRSLDRAAAPAGFEARLRSRIAARQSQPTGIWARIRAWAQPAGGRQMILRPAVTLLLICILVVGSVFVFNAKQSQAPDTDWAYIDTCQSQHTSFAVANPLADESAAALREHAREAPDAL
jgi:hypothetical protein